MCLVPGRLHCNSQNVCLKKGHLDLEVRDIWGWAGTRQCGRLSHLEEEEKFGRYLEEDSWEHRRAQTHIQFSGEQLGTQTNNLVENSWGIARTQTLLLSSR